MENHNKFPADFFRGKRVFITGHTGFKGSWLSRLLLKLGAEVSGYALAPPPGYSLFRLAGIEENMRSIIGDIRDRDSLGRAVGQARPELVIHMAAQPLVRAGYQDPVGTFEINVMGTVNLLDCLRGSEQTLSILNVTTDKVYLNDERFRPFAEDDPLGGHDPYACSKSCSELVTAAYKRSFFEGGRAAVSTARSGNVIGGGDFAADRIVPDCLRAALKKENIVVRNPDSVRPYQHVLEALEAYLLIVAGQTERPGTAGSYNVAPAAENCARTGELVQCFCELWGGGLGWETRPDNGPREDVCLRLDASRLSRTFGWRPRWDLSKALALTIDWTRAWAAGQDVGQVMDRQIDQALS